MCQGIAAPLGVHVKFPGEGFVGEYERAGEGVETDIAEVSDWESPSEKIGGVEHPGRG